jgi:bifunctional enzyme CysN/CysC
MATVQARDIVSFLVSQREKDTLRFITCGSVDDGKSTLIGRLLHESKCIFDDQLKSLETDSKQFGTQSEKIDFALLVDGLQAEREQGITIDVAYRFFATDKRRYIVADTPGHEQYTRNMATGASTAHLAILLIDVRKGILTQTRRHSRIVSMMGIRHVLLAINKMDLVNFDPTEFKRIEDEYRSYALGQGFETIQAIPVSALDGDNILQPSERMPWYLGPTLLDYLDTVPAMVPAAGKRNTFRMPVQWVNRPSLDFRGFCGRIAEGTLRPGDLIRVLPSSRTSVVKKIIIWHDPLEVANSGDAVTLVLADELDISRGDVIVATDHPPEIADQFEARLLWMADQPLMPGRPYIMKLHCKEVTATVTEIKYLEDINSGAHLATKTISLNAIAMVNLSTSQPVIFEPYSLNRTMGGFILIDKLNFQTVGAGMIEFALRRASNIHWQAVEVNRASRAALINQTPKCIWLTGLSGSGKSTIANILEKRLHSEGRLTYLLDGDNIRHGLNRDLGFTEADRVENIRRVSEVARLMMDAGLIVLVSFISPYASERNAARALFAKGEFIEVFVDTPLEECERRDVKGLYKKARSGNLKNFTGIDSPYEMPQTPEIHLRTVEIDAETCAETIAMMLNESTQKV